MGSDDESSQDGRHVPNHAPTVASSVLHHDIAGRQQHLHAIVELDDCGGVLVPSNVIDCTPEAMAVGMPVVVEWDEITDEITFPRFRRA